ncbi:hypothetical protein [Streptomyces tsukubensis]|uniref:hypothetical protein n=1 Tax=Streptomyces tsukubensis TaxID=83656 RepID=UPI00345102AC
MKPLGIEHRRYGKLRAAALVTAVVAMVTTFSVAPAGAVGEGGWSNGGGSARSDEAAAVVNDLGGEYTAAIGNDNRIWWSFNGGLFQPVSQGHQVNFAPAMISWQGRITLFHTGIDRQIYYSFLQDRSSNSWTPWQRVPGDAGLAGSPTVVTSGNTAYISGVRVGGELTEQRMTAQSGGFTFGSGYRNDPSARVRITPIVLNLGLGEAVNVPENAGEAIGVQTFVVGQDAQVWRSRRPLGSFTGSWSQVPGMAECESSVAAGRGGPSQIVGPGDPNYQDQQHVALACIGRDLNVWVNQSTDGGDTFHGWRRTTGGPAPSNATPSLSSAGSSITLSIAWDGNRDPRFPNNAIVEKQLYR